MSLIRYDLYTFVRQWNCHHIRKQKARLHVVPGKLISLYLNANPETAFDCGVAVSEEALKELERCIELDGVDLEAYLPQEMTDLCFQYLEDMPEPPHGFDPDSPAVYEFRYLSSKLHQHDRLKLQPGLVMLDKPTGGGPECLKKMRNAQIRVEDLEGDVSDVESVLDSNIIDLEE